MTCAIRVRVRLSATLEYRPIAIDLVSTLIAHVSNADRAFRNGMITAFGEAYNNVAIHGYRDRSDGFLEVEAEMGPDSMTLRLSDNGLPIDFDSVVPPDLDSIPDHGMGIFMIRSMVDDVAYESGEPNVLTLTKRMLPTEPDRLARPGT
jgi:serine/threonine-protein kinase RsbW